MTGEEREMGMAIEVIAVLETLCAMSVNWSIMLFNFQNSSTQTLRVIYGISFETVMMGFLSVGVRKEEVEADQYIMKYSQSIWMSEKSLSQSNERTHLINNDSPVTSQGQTEFHWVRSSRGVKQKLHGGGSRMHVSLLHNQTNVQYYKSLKWKHPSQDS